MIGIEGRVIAEVFAEAVARWPERDFLVVPRKDEAPVRVLSYAR